MAGAVLRRAVPVLLVLAAASVAGGCTALFDADELELADTVADGASDVDIAEDTEPPPIAVSGSGTCHVVFVDDAVTCPKTCPVSGGWTVVFDASARGASQYAWDVTTESPFQVTPVGSLDGPVATVKVDFDGAEVTDCLPDRESLGDVRVYAFLAEDGAALPSTPTATALLKLSTVNTPQCSTQSECPEP